MSEQLTIDGREVVAGDRPADDFYRTPAWVTRALLRYLPEPPQRLLRVLDAGAGDGAIGRVVEEVWPCAGIWAIERNPNRLAQCPEHWNRRQADFLTYALTTGPFDLAVSNPPFGADGSDTWTDFALRLLEHDARWTAVLGFANVLGGQARYQRLWSKHVPYLIIHVGRPKYREEKGTDPRDTVWVVWDGYGTPVGQTRFRWAGGEV